MTVKHGDYTAVRMLMWCMNGDLRDKMKSRTIEIIDNHIKALEEEIEWYQKKNIEWQEKYDTLEKQKLADINSVEKLINENAHLKQVAANHHNNWMTSQQENARLRDQLRWRDAKKEPPNKSDHYIVMTTLGMLALIYYNYTSTYGWSIPGIVSKWCYIPDDNQGTDCTPEDGDE